MCVDAVRGVSAIRIEMVRVALLRHHPHTLSGAGRTLSVYVSVNEYVHRYYPGYVHVCTWMSKLLGLW